MGEFVGLIILFLLFCVVTSPVRILSKKLFDHFTWVKPRDNDVINICDKDNTILCCNKFKDMRLIEISDYLGQDVIEQQMFYNEKDKNTIYYITIEK